MKHRTFPIVSLLATFPALAFHSSFGSVMPLDGLGLPTLEVGFIRKDSVLADSIADITITRVMPKLPQTQKVTLPLNGISAQVFRYTNGKQSLSFKYSEESGTVQPESGQQNTSTYQSLLLKLAEPVASNELKVLLDEGSSNFILSTTAKTAYQIKVPSRVDKDDYPEWVLTGFTMLHHTSLKDITSAWSCYKNAGYFFYSTVICDDGSHLSWNEEERLYVYQATTAAPSPPPPDFSFGWQQFGFDESWLLSDEYLLLTLKGKPVKISAIGEISSKEEPADGNPNSTNKRSGSGNPYTAPSNTAQSSPSVPTRHKVSSSGSAGGNEPPRRPVKYDKKEPKDGVVSNKPRKKIDNSDGDIDFTARKDNRKLTSLNKELKHKKNQNIKKTKDDRANKSNKDPKRKNKDRIKPEDYMNQSGNESEDYTSQSGSESEDYTSPSESEFEDYTSQ